MDKLKQLILVDALLALAATLIALTGLLKFLLLKASGTLAAIGLTYKNLPMADVSTIHDYSGVAFVLLAAAHLALHKDWIAAQLQRLTQPPKPPIPAAKPITAPAPQNPQPPAPPQA